MHLKYLISQESGWTLLNFTCYRMVLRQIASQPNNTFIPFEQTNLLTGKKGNGHYSHNKRFISIGAITADKIKLSEEIWRNPDLFLSGSGLVSSKSRMKKLFSETIPEIFQLAVLSKLKVDTQIVNITDIERFWGR